MACRPGYKLVFAPEIVRHLDAIERKYHRLIERAIAEQLRHEPVTMTRNRKPLEDPAHSGATWELRCGPQNRFRIFYEINLEQASVLVLAIGVKKGNRLLVGGEEFEL
jgi:mRNA-degrading endonuclease RelE of RelBE toxin-antitoxin system